MGQQHNYADLRKIVSGDIIVKCRFGNDIRRVPINQAPSYDELCVMMYRLFRNHLPNPEQITLKYTDDEGDLISMTDDTDVNHAISQSPLLKITVFGKDVDSPEVPSLEDLQSQITKLSEMLQKVVDAPAIKDAKQQASNRSEPSVPEKTYRQLTTAEMADFLDEHKHGQKKTETTAPSSSSSHPPPPLPSSQPTGPTSQQQPPRVPAAPPQPQQQAQMPYAPPPLPQQQQQSYPPQQQPSYSGPNTGMPQQQPPQASPSYPPPPATPQTPVSYAPERPPAAPAPPTYNQPGYPQHSVSAPSAPPSSASQYYYPPQQQQQRPPGWR